MPIRMPVDIDIVERHCGRLLVQPHVKADTLIHYRAISLCVQQGIGKPIRRCDHIINQPDFAKIEITSEVKTEKSILKLF